MLKKHGAIALLALSLSVSSLASQERVDLIVALDSSRSMFAYYGQVVDYVLSGVVREYMRSGDGFHLLSFADASQVEIAQVLRTESDLRSVIARLYLLYPLGRSTDLVSALRYVYRYVGDLPAGSAKHIVLITDGMHAPSPSSPYASLDPTAVKAELESTAALIRERGWTLRIVRVPFDSAGTASAGTASAGTAPATPAQAGQAGLRQPGDADAMTELESGAPGAGNYLDDVARSAGAIVSVFDPSSASASISDAVTLPVITFDPDLGTRSHAFQLNAEIHNRSGEDLAVELTRLLLADGTDILKKKAIATIPAGKTGRLSLSVALPETVPDGPTTLIVEPRFADGLRASPARSTLTLTVKRSALGSLMRNTGLVALFLTLLALALAAVIAVVAYVRRAHRQAEEPVIGAFIDAAASPRTDTRHASPYASSSSTVGARHESPYATAPGAIGAHRSPYDTSMGAQGAHRSPYDTGSTQPGARADAAATLASAKALTQGHASSDILSAAAKSSRRNEAAEALSAYRDRGVSHASPLLRSKAAASAAPSRAPISFSASVRRPGSLRIMLRVKDQTPHIGKRNIKTLHAGGKATVGGGSSDFLVFLLSVPRRIGLLYYDGEVATFVPAMPDYFPDYDGPIRDCLGKEIRAITARGKELILTFDRYEAPEERLNKILHCIEAPGI